MNQIDLAVNGTLMWGFDLNANLTSIGANFIRETRTAPEYRLWSINNLYPAMQRDVEHGKAIVVEIWSISPEGLLTILQQEPPGLVLGKITLADHSTIFGILDEAWVCENQHEIIHFGGWRNYWVKGLK